MKNVLDTLEERGLVAQCSDEALREKLAEERMTAYVGFDPTATSLHLGHLVPIMILGHLQRAGHRVLALIGGATGMIGDPSGRSDERSLLRREAVAANAAAIKAQLARFLRFDGENPAVMLDNYDWIGPMTFIDWLREVGKHFTVSYMLSKESVRKRMATERGISFTEFAYMTMQAYDFLHLFDEEGCVLQCGGNDQWGNITAGIELIRRTRGRSAFGLTSPLVATAAGEKFGKSAGNAIWLDADRTAPWDLFQYLIRQEDRDVIRLLNLYTFLPAERIEELEDSLRVAPGRRMAQEALAFEVTRLVHGAAEAEVVGSAAKAIYAGATVGLSDAVLRTVFASAPSSNLSRARLEVGVPIIDLLVQTCLAKSKGAARRLLKSGGIYLNNNRAAEDAVVTLDDLASETMLVLRTGKKNYHIVRVA